MTDAVAIAAIGAFAAIANAVISAFTNRRMGEVEKKVNGQTEHLLKIGGDARYQDGVRDQKEHGK
jgi:hypothetical protein